MERQAEDTKERILTAALKTFAEKGFSGARIDQIAQTAKVNKALIYYYFTSKNAILEELFSVFFRTSSEMLCRFVEAGGFAENAEENKSRFEAEYLRYMEANKELLKTIVMESLKNDTADPPLFKLVDITGNVPAERLKNLPVPPEDIREQRQEMVTEFFTGIMPYVSYLMLKEKWCAHFHMTAAELKTAFDRAMEETHEQYHKKRTGKLY